MNEYICKWKTKIGVGSTFYQGTTTVKAEDEDQARDKAQRLIHRNFSEYPLGHIIVTNVSRWIDR